MGRNFSNTSTGDSVDAIGNAAGDGADTQAAETVAALQVDVQPDEGHGRGGLYELRDGRRVLIERTAQEGSAA